MSPSYLAITLILTALALAPPGTQDLLVIVNAERELKLSRAELAQIYLKRRRFWEDGRAIIAVNRESGSRTREIFARRALGDEERNLETYWNRQYFQGVLPPATLASDEAVLRFVAEEPLAIGYVAAEPTDPSVRVVLRLGAP